ncbi:MAG: cytidine deaminase [Prevotella sp.]|jgi:cytidine deaminase|nr:cytidine deaminase [Prevotella sp.]MBR1525423.1 cytidine deaminase [Prevotella sp.]MDY6229974.1 cytidine deaminase [Prevotella sp.]MDY6409201.1 cytidine deaminase [Prevotella sp.]
MKKINISIDIELKQKEELSAEEQILVDKAIEATTRSYSVYSHFAVGAALMLENGDIVLGANQENAAFPSGLCAERTAIFAAQVNNPDQPLKTIAIAARNENGLLKKPITPCGGCRQVMLEIEDRYKKPVKILLYGTEGIYVINSVKDIMPLSFVSDDLTA